MLNSYRTNTLDYNPALCNGCGRCVEVCPHAVFRMNGKRAELAAPWDCMECGACMVNCAAGAIRVESGVGCAAAMIQAALRGSPEATCGDPDAVAGCCGGSAASDNGCGCEADQMEPGHRKEPAPAAGGCCGGSSKSGGCSCG